MIKIIFSIILIFSTSYVSAGESPLLAKLVKLGKLPPLEERLPPNPIVVKNREIGKYGGTLSIGIKGEKTWFGDPQSAIGPQPLLRYSEDFSKPLPNIARKWEWSNGGKWLTLDLIEGARWSDGEPFTADAIMWWYKNVLTNKEITAKPASRWAPGEEVMGMTKLSEYKIRYEFKVPHPAIEFDLLHYQGGMYSWLPAHYSKQFHADFVEKDKLDELVKAEGFDNWVQLFKAKNSICSMMACSEGMPTMDPYTIEKFSTEYSILKRNPYYWKVDEAGNQLPYIDEVGLYVYTDPEVLKLKAIQGEFDIFGQNSNLEDYPVYKKNAEKAGYNIYNWMLTDAGFMGFQYNLTISDPVKRKIFRDKRFRIASSHAINREEVNETLFFGLVKITNYTAHPATPWYNEDYAMAHTSYDPELSNKLLDEMGLKDRDSDGYRKMPDGRTLEVKYEGENTQAWARPVEELVQDYLRQVGIKMDIDVKDRELWTKRANSNQIEFSQWVVVGFTGSMVADPRSFVPWRQSAETVWYGGGEGSWEAWALTGGTEGEEPPFEVKEIIRLMKEARMEFDQDKKIKLLDQILKIHSEERYGFSILGPVLKPVLVNKNLANVPLDGYHGYDGIRMQPYFPEAFYFKN